MKLIIFCFLLLASCAKQYEEAPFTGIDAEFIGYLELYNQIRQEELGQGPVYFAMGFGEQTKPNQMGRASSNGFSCWIVIVKEKWERLDDNGKKELLFHEILHCDYVGMRHIEGTLMGTKFRNTNTPEEDLRFIFRNF